MNTNKYRTKLMPLSGFKKYFLSHVTGMEENPNFFIVRRDMKVFKRTRASIVSLLIPEGARVFSDICEKNHLSLRDNFYISDRKMRADQAKVVRIYDILLDKDVRSDSSLHDSSFIYYVGKTVTPKYEFSTSAFKCSSGIHFFLQLNDALDYPS